MERIRLIVLCIIVLIAVVAASVLVVRERVNREGYEKISLGMSLGEVETIVGKRGTDIPKQRLMHALLIRARAGNSVPDGDSLQGDWNDVNTAGTMDWYSDNCAITVGLDKNRIVVWKYYMPFPRRNVLDRLREWGVVWD